MDTVFPGEASMSLVSECISLKVVALLLQRQIYDPSVTKTWYAPGILSPTLTAKRGEAENWRLLCREQRGIALAARCLVLSIVVADTIYVSIGLDGAATNVSDLTFTVCRQAVWTGARRSST